MKIEHNEICLRDVTAADCKQLGKWWNDGSIMAHAGFPNGLGTTEEEIWEKTKNDSDTTRRRPVSYTHLFRIYLSYPMKFGELKFDMKIAGTGAVCHCAEEFEREYLRWRHSMTF